MFSNITNHFPISVALLQYMIYLSNIHHNGIIFSSLPNNFTEECILFMIHSGWNMTNNFMQVVGNLGPSTTGIVLKHLSKLIEEKVFKIDIVKARKFLLTVMSEKYCRLLRFICEHCNEEEKIYLFSSVRYFETSISYYETTIFNHMINNCRDLVIPYILPHIPPSCLLEKSTRKTKTSDRYFTSLHYAICNSNISTQSIAKIVECQPSLIEMPDNEGITPLHLIAININRWSLVEVWKTYGVDLNVKSSRGLTPLDYAKMEYPKYALIFEEQL